MLKIRRLNEIEIMLVSQKLNGLICKCAKDKYREIVETQTGHIACNTCKTVVLKNSDYKELIKKKRLELSIQGYTNVNVYDLTRETLLESKAY